MKRTRAVFKLAVRYCKDHVEMHACMHECIQLVTMHFAHLHVIVKLLLRYHFKLFHYRQDCRKASNCWY